MKKALSLLLVLAMVLSMVPAVFAEETTTETEAIVYTDMGAIADLNGLTVSKGATVQYTYTPAATCELTLETVGDAVVYVDDVVVLGEVIDIELEDNLEGDIDVDDAYGDVATYVFSANTSYIIKLLGQNSATTLNVTGTKYQGASEDWRITIYAMDFDENGTYTVSVPANTTYYYCAMYCGGNNLVIGDGEPIALTGMSYDFSITNTGAEAADYVLTLSAPLGSMENPAVLIEGSNVSTHVAGSQGYYYTYTAPADGTLTLTFYANSGTGWTYVVNNLTTYAYGDTQWSDSDPVVNPAEIAVSEGNVIEVMVNTYNAEDPYNAPAGEMEIMASFSYPEGTENNPIQLYPQMFPYTATVPANTTYYYVLCNANGMELTIGDSTPVIVAQNSMAGYEFTITNEGAEEATYAMTLAAPVGSMDNPDALVIGENTATISEGASGYFYTWTAEEDGTLSITMPEGNWSYAINNLTAGTYGDTQWSDSDPVVNPGTVEVTAGDEIQVIVNTYDPSAWITPAGTLTITAAFEPAAFEFKWGHSLELQSELSIQWSFAASLVTGAEDFYVIISKTEGYVDETRVIDLRIDKEDLKYTNSKYYAKFPYISACDMGVEMSAVLYIVDADGTVRCSKPDVYSVRHYANALINKYQASADATDNTTKAYEAMQLAVELLNYGAAAQKNFSFMTDDYVNAHLTDAQKAFAVQDCSYVNSRDWGEGNSSAEIVFKGNLLELQSRISYAIRVETKNLTSASVDDLTVIVTNKNTGVELEKIAGSDLRVDTARSNSYYIDITGIDSINMRTLVNIVVYANYGTESQIQVSSIATNSIETYVALAVNSGSASADVSLALLKYGDAAVRYFT